MRRLAVITFFLTIIALPILPSSPAKYESLISEYKQSLKMIASYSAITDSCKQIGITTKKKSNKPSARSLSQAKQVFAECKNILNTISFYESNYDGGIDRITYIDGVVIPPKVLSRHRKLHMDYGQISIDNKFFQNNMFTPKQVYPSETGMVLTYVSGVYYIALSNWQYWAPTVMKDAVQEDPLFDKIIRPTICADARVVYKSDYDKLLKSNNNKQDALNKISQHINSKVIPIVEKVYQSKEVELSQLLSEINTLNTDAHNSLDKSSLIFADYGVYIPKKRNKDYKYILGLATSYKALLDGYFKNYEQAIRKNNIVDGMYYLSLLISADKGGIWSTDYKKYINIITSNKKLINDNLHSSNRIEDGPLKSYFKHPLTNEEALLYASLNARDNISEFSHSLKTRDQLPFAKITAATWQKLVEKSKKELVSVTEMKSSLKTDSDIIQNLYIPQKSQLEVSSFTTDYYDIAGAAAGDYLLLKDGKDYKYYSLEFPVTEGWGVKQFGIKLTEVTEVDPNARVNVRLK